MGREWIKLYVDKWLDGSISWELTDAQVGVWSKILALAGRYYREGKREGLIPLSKEAIQHAIKSRRRIFEKAWDKLIETDRIKVVEEGVFVVNYMRLNPSRWEVWAASHPDEAGRDRHKPSQTPTNALKQTQALETDTETDINSLSKDKEGPLSPSTEAGKYLFSKSHRKRFANLIQKEMFENCEAEVGLEKMTEAIDWALKSGIHNLKSIVTAAKRNKGPGGVPTKYTRPEDV